MEWNGGMKNGMERSLYIVISFSCGRHCSIKVDLSTMTIGLSLLAYFLVWYHDVMVRNWALPKSGSPELICCYYRMEQKTSYSIMHVSGHTLYCQERLLLGL